MSKQLQALPLSYSCSRKSSKMLVNRRGILGKGSALAGTPGHAGGGSRSSTPPVFNEVIHWYDFADLTTLWQDEAMTIPAVADEDEINVIHDKGLWTHDLSTELTTDPEVDLLTYGRPTGVFNAQTLGGIDTDFPSPRPGDTYTYVAVAASTAATQEQYIHYWFSIPRHGLRTTPTDEVTTTLDASAVSTANYALGQPLGILARNDSGNISILNSLDGGDGYDFTNDTYGISAGTANFRIGGYNESGLGEFWVGNIMELIWWNRALTDSEVADVKEYLNNKWSMSWS